MEKQGLDKKIYIFIHSQIEKFSNWTYGKTSKLIFKELLKFLVAAILSSAKILYNLSPFGVSFVASSAITSKGIAPIIGSFFGYVVFIGGVDGIKYSAASLIALTIANSFKDTRFFEKRLFMPFASAISIAITGFVFVFNSGTTYTTVMLFLCEILLAFGLTYFYSLIENPPNQKSNVLKLSGLVIFSSSILMSFAGFSILNVISPARVVAVLLIMAVSYRCGINEGATMGVIMGVTMDASTGNSPFFTCVYGFASLISGVFNGMGKTAFICAYIIANGAASLLGILDVHYTSVLYESFIASVIFAVIPDIVWIRFKLYSNNELISNIITSPTYGDRAVRRSKKYINEISAAFHELYTAVSSGTSVKSITTKNNEDVNLAFQKAADKVCRNCPISNVCWERDYITTKNVLNDITNIISQNHRAERDDFPHHFSERCVNFTEFLSSLNLSISSVFSRRNYNEKIENNKNIFAEQLSSLSDVLLNTSLEAMESNEIMQNLEQPIMEYMQSFCKIDEVAVYRDRSKRMHIELCGENLSQITHNKSILSGLSTMLGINLKAPEQVTDEFGTRLTICEKEKFKIRVGISIAKKDGEDVSGDSGTYFITDEGIAYLLLSDGMGSGSQAAYESATAVKLLEKFLRAGIHPIDSLKAVTPALKIRSSNQSFVTIDIAGINLSDGSTTLVKYGAAPTYVKSKNKLTRFASSNLPAGVDFKNSPDISKFTIKENDIIIMVSDGICDSTNDKHLLEFLETSKDLTPRQYAKNILELSSKNGNNDDMTVIILELLKNNE